MSGYVGRRPASSAHRRRCKLPPGEQRRGSIVGCSIASRRVRVQVVDSPPPNCVGLAPSSAPLQVVGTGRRSTSRAAARQVAAAATASRPAAATAPAASGSSTERPQAPASTDLSCLTDEELQQTLALRRLSEAGGRQKQERRLAAFLADPSAFPSAACRPTVTAAVLAGRLFAGQLQLRSHIQLLLQLLRSEPEVAPGHPDFAFLLALLQRHPRYSQKARRVLGLRGAWGAGCRGARQLWMRCGGSAGAGGAGQLCQTAGLL